MLCIIPDTA